MKKISVKFPKGITTVHIPFIANLDSYDQLHEQMKRIKYPKSARRIEASLVCSVDLKDGSTSHESAQVTVFN